MTITINFELVTRNRHNDRNSTWHIGSLTISGETIEEITHDKMTIEKYYNKNTDLNPDYEYKVLEK